MTYSYELSKHTNDVKTEIRKFKAIKYKKLRCKWSQIFNQVCLKVNKDHQIFHRLSCIYSFLHL